MGKHSRLDKISWFVNPWFDIIFLAGFPIGLMVTVLPLIYYPSHFLKFIFYTEALTNFPHMFAGFTVCFVSQKEWKKKPIMYIAVPLFLFITAIIFSVSGYFQQIMMIRTFWGMYHIFTQNRLILHFHKLLNNDFQKIDKILDISAIITASLFTAFWIFILNKRIFTLQMILVWIVVIAFIARQIYLFIRRNKTSSFFKISMVSSFASAFYYPIIITKNAFATIRAGIITHNLQYLAWCWLYYRKSFKAGLLRGIKDLSCLSQPILYILFFILLGLIALSHVWTVSLRPDGFFIISVFYAAFAFVHFFLESRIWKASRDRGIFPNN